jgi:mannonate dehydratase
MAMNRREALSALSIGGGASLLTSRSSFAETLSPASGAAFQQAVKGTAPVTIRDIKTILTAPNRIRLVVVKVETSEPGLVGWGCATFTQRALVVATAVNDYLKPLLIGRNVDEIEDIWQSSYVSSYWRNGGILFNAMSGVDIALWDIKGKRAGMPVYQLLGGKVRAGADCYYHASGASFTEVEENARKGMEAGFRHVRVQVSTPGYASYGARSTVATPAAGAGGAGAAGAGAAGATGAAGAGGNEVIGPTHPVAIWESAPYVRMLPKFFEHMRTKLGDEVELLHDVHERVTLNEAINLCKSLEPYRLFFLEDPFPPEDNDHFRLLRQQTSIPLAMGELFNTQHEYVPLIKDRLIDFIRIHISQIGGLSPARKVAALCEYFGVRTAWHGPGDASPLAHAAQLALELASYNFGVHEGGSFPKETAEVFAGSPEQKNGYLLANEKPGLGIDVDEKLAAKFPFPPGPPNFDYSWGTTRRKDGTVIRP